MRSGLFTLVFLLAAASAKCLAAGYEIPVYPRSAGSGPELQDTAHLKLGSQAADWLPRYLRVLRANRPPRFQLDTVALLHGAGDGTYLAVTWRGRSIRTPRIEFHKVVIGDDGRRLIKFLRAFADRDVDLVRPSGREVFKGEAPVAVVRLGSGGSGLEGHGLKLVQMHRDTVDITPDWAGRVVDVVDLDGDGQYELVAIDSRWAGYFDGRGSAGPHLPVILARADGAFAPACRTHAEVYRRWIETHRAYGRDAGNPAALRAETLAAASLAAAQIGAFAEARRSLAELEALYAESGRRTSFPEPARVIGDYAAALDWAERLPDSQCPASAIRGGGGRHGTKGLNRHFTFSGD